jgi:hypothetical protein
LLPKRMCSAVQASGLAGRDRMSRYELTGKEPRYRIVVGWDNTLPIPPGSMPGTLYVQVEDREWASGQAGVDEADAESEVGDTPEEGLLVWIGQGVDDLISDVKTLVGAVAPYGTIPLATQVDLLRDMDRDWPRSWQTVGAAMAAVCQQAPAARLASKPEEGKFYYILLDEQGWQLREWPSLLEQGSDYERTFASMVLPTESDRAQYHYADPLASYVSDPSIILRIHPSGFTLGLPVFAAFDRGVMLAGPVVIACEDRGLSASQVLLVAQEISFVEESIRGGVTALWTHVWSTMRGRSDE